MRARDATLADTEQSARTLSHSLAQHAARTIEGVDLVLWGIVERVQGNADRLGLQSYLERRAKSLRQSHVLAVFDAHGSEVADSVSEHGPVNIADRDYFTWERDHADPGLHIDSIVVSRLFNQPDHTAVAQDREQRRGIRRGRGSCADAGGFPAVLRQPRDRASRDGGTLDPNGARPGAASRKCLKPWWAGTTRHRRSQRPSHIGHPGFSPCRPPSMASGASSRSKTSNPIRWSSRSASRPTTPSRVGAPNPCSRRSLWPWPPRSWWCWPVSSNAIAAPKRAALPSLSRPICAIASLRRIPATSSSFGRSPSRPGFTSHPPPATCSVGHPRSS